MRESLACIPKYPFSLCQTLENAWLEIQRLLPPITPLRSQLISNGTNTRQIKIQNLPIISIVRKRRQTRPVRIARDDKIREIVLHDQSQRIILHRIRRPLIERISDIIAMQRGRHRKDVRPRRRRGPEGAREVVRVAGKDGVGDDGISARDLVRVAARPVEDRRVECVRNVRRGVIRRSVREGHEDDVLRERLRREYVGRCEEESFVGVVSDQQLQGLVVLSVQEK